MTSFKGKNLEVFRPGSRGEGVVGEYKLYTKECKSVLVSEFVTLSARS